MALFGDITGFIDAGRAANSISNSNIAAEHGVLGATSDGQQGISNAVGTGTTAVNNAGQNVNNAATSANTNLAGLNATNQANLAPALQSGAQGNTSLQAYAASNPQFNFQPTQTQLAATPGYQFQLNQGTNAITNAASAMGLNQGGKTLTDLTQYGQGLAGTYYQNAFNNAQSQFQTNQNSTLSNLQALIGSGATAAGQSASSNLATGQTQSANTTGAAATNASLQQYNAGLGVQGAENSGGLGLNGATTAGNFAVDAGQAHAGGIAAQGNNLTAGVSDLAGLTKLIPGLGGGS